MALSAKRLAFGQNLAAATSHLLYTVPPGRRAILRDVRMEIDPGAVGTCAVELDEPPAAGNTAVLLRDGAATRVVADLTDAFIVLEQGCTVTLRNSTNGVADCWLSGHEFVVN